MDTEDELYYLRKMFSVSAWNFGSSKATTGWPTFFPDEDPMIQKETLGFAGRVNGAAMERIREITVEYLKARKNVDC